MISAHPGHATHDRCWNSASDGLLQRSLNYPVYLRFLEELECSWEAVVEVSEMLAQYPLPMLFLTCREDDEKGVVDAKHYK